MDKILDNAIGVRITDHSRPVAGDRWQVKLVCVVSMAIDDAHFADHHAADPDLLARIRTRLGDEIRLEMVRERNFIDAGDLDTIKEDLRDRLNHNINAYLTAPAFPAFFFERAFREAENAERANRSIVAPIDEGEDDESGPADFSACFRD